MAKLKYSERHEGWVLETEDNIIRIGAGTFVPRRFDEAEVVPKDENSISTFSVKLELDGKEKMEEGLADIELQAEKAARAVSKLHLALENL